jgi:TFIIF-interacting CTD phosphatase-like protein
MKKLVLDLDETLLYSTLEPVLPEAVQLVAAGSTFYTTLRPGAKAFLEEMSRKFECYIWSTGQQVYLESVWNYIDVPGYTLWGREYCRKIETQSGAEAYEKPLRQITEDLSEIVIVDNSPAMFAKCPLNGILSRTWRGDMNDTELTHLRYYLDWLNTQESMQRDHQSWRLETLCLRSK